MCSQLDNRHPKDKTPDASRQEKTNTSPSSHVQEQEFVRSKGILRRLLTCLFTSILEIAVAHMEGPGEVVGCASAKREERSPSVGFLTRRPAPARCAYSERRGPRNRPGAIPHRPTIPRQSGACLGNIPLQVVTPSGFQPRGILVPTDQTKIPRCAQSLALPRAASG